MLDKDSYKIYSYLLSVGGSERQQGRHMEHNFVAVECGEYRFGTGGISCEA